MTIRQRFFFLIGVYVFCGFLRIFVKSTAKTLLAKLEEARANAEAKKDLAGRVKNALKEEQVSADRYASN